MSELKIPYALDHDFLNNTDTTHVIRCRACHAELYRSAILRDHAAIDAAVVAHVCPAPDVVTLLRQYLAEHDAGNAFAAHLTLNEIRKRLTPDVEPVV